ncbi:MAG: hypothetical protein HFI85_05210 [Clostridia bacterium]|jgi:endonuclease/exonuclease/phosphatase family metal-dependent hydrolase|nr:hypothetical protein [Clostridia bacterium]
MRILDLNVSNHHDNIVQLKDMIYEKNPDICAFQEVMNGIDDECFEIYQLRRGLDEIKEYPYTEFAPLFVAKGVTKNGIYVQSYGGRAQQGMMLLSKHEIIDHQNLFYYNDYKYEYDATHFREQDWCRSIQSAIIKVEGKQLQIINVHGVWNEDKTDDERTLAQTEFILKEARDDIPSIILGDFNLLPSTKSMDGFEPRFKNLIKEFDIKSTRPTFDDGLDKGDLVCDYILVNDKIKVKAFEVVEKVISDHLALLMEFDLID